MGSGNRGLIAAGGLVLLALLFAISTYNGLVNLQQAVDTRWARVQDAYQHRSDLVPEALRIIQNSAIVGKAPISDVAAARLSLERVQLASGAPVDAERLDAFDRAQGQLGSALSRLLVLADQYPNVTGTAAYKTVRAQIEISQARIGVERDRFDDEVRMYDSAIGRFPAAIFARAMGYRRLPGFGHLGRPDIPK